MDTLTKQQKQQVEKAETSQAADLKQAAKKIKSEQVRTKFTLPFKAYLFTMQTGVLITQKKKHFENFVGKRENAGNFFKVQNNFKYMYIEFVFCKCFCLYVTFCYLVKSKNLIFVCLLYKSFENTVGKGEIAHNEQFFPFRKVFSTLLGNFLPFSSNLKLFSSNYSHRCSCIVVRV